MEAQHNYEVLLDERNYFQDMVLSMYKELEEAKKRIERIIETEEPIMAINIDTYAYSDTKIPICINGVMIGYVKIDLDKLDKVFDSLLEQVVKSEGEEEEK